MNYWLGVIGCWIFSDGLYSLMLYLNAEGFGGKRQTWKRDHWLRAIRMVLGIAIIIIGRTT
jgi:hypothetical protein